MREQVLKEWTNCKEKIKKLKTNDQVRLSLLLSPEKLAELERQLKAKEAQIEQMRNKVGSGDASLLLYWEDYKKYNHLQWEIKDLREQLANQEEIRNFDWDRFLHDRRYILVLKREKNEYLQDLRMSNEKLDKVKELLKTQQFNELLTLYQQKKI